MVDFRTHIDVVGTGFSGVPGTIPIKRPFPSLGGKLRAAYLFGTEYANFAPDPVGRAMGVLYDWSGRGQHITNFGIWRPSQYWIECHVSTLMPCTPFTADALIDDPAEGVTLVAFHWADATAKSVSLIRSIDGLAGGTSDPYFGLILQPPTTSGRLLAIHNNTTSVQAPLTPLPDELGAVAMYAGVYTTASRNCYAQGPGVSIKTGTPENTSKTLESAGRFDMGVESGAQTGLNRLLGCAFYREVLTPTELTDEVRADFGEWMGAIGSGLTIT